MSKIDNVSKKFKDRLWTGDLHLQKKAFRQNFGHGNRLEFKIVLFCAFFVVANYKKARNICSNNTCSNYV